MLSKRQPYIVKVDIDIGHTGSYILANILWATMSSGYYPSIIKYFLEYINYRLALVFNDS